MKVTVVRPRELGRSERYLWQQLLRDSDTAGGNPFLSPEFAEAVDRAREGARVAVLQDTTGTVGFFPHERRGRLLGTAIGAGISDCQGLVHAPGLWWDARALVRGCGLPVWEFDHLVAAQEPFAPYHSAVAGSPVMDFGDGFEAYLRARSRDTSALKTAQRKLRKLEREVGELEFEFDCPDPAVLRTLMTWKSEQYRRTGARDTFATGWVTRVVTELLCSREPGCTGTLSVLRAGGRPVAAHFGLRSQRVLSYWFPAYDPDLARYSAGLGLLLRMAEESAGRGIRQIDLGRGQQRYKDEFATGELRIAKGRVGVSRPVTAARRTRAALHSGVSWTLDRRALRPVKHLAKRARHLSRG
jgi:CelD/BcsL family acetyltransferase involved in cellulose biosynthesis